MSIVSDILGTTKSTFTFGIGMLAKLATVATTTLKTYTFPNYSGDVVVVNTTGIVAQTGSNQSTTRTITGTTNQIDIANGNGVSGNPTASISATYPGQASITTLGTISTGVWNGTDIAVVDGGTGASTAAGARTNLGVAIGSDVQAYDPTLASLAAYNTNGLLTQTAADTFTGRTLTGPAAGVTVTNGNGVAGNPTLALANDLAAVEGLGTTGIATRTAADTWTTRTITGTANEITVTNGDGVSGDPTVSIPSAVTLTGKTLTGGAYTGTAITSSTVDSSVVGGTTPAAGTFTTLTANTSATLNTLALTTDLAVTEGGTGASTAADARTNLGLAIGTNVQAWNAILDTIASSTYTPTRTNISNVTSSTAHVASYIRFGNIVFVFGRISFTATTAGLDTQIDLSLPIASNIGAAGDIAGSGGSITGGNEAWGVQGDATNDRATLRGVAVVTTAHTVGYSYAYRVI